ncbi:hypothetical protein F4808DRAFT_451932 [Astrocystis sublimbata]|nr:hypothetical protein F4808DRAFT_451932 [Astrocystis sublimbata]
MGKQEQVEAAADAAQWHQATAPPSYDTPSAINTTDEAVEQLDEAFRNLSLLLIADDVTEDTCLAHLKLLFAFQNLKEAVGYNDGLWQIHDSHLFSQEKGADPLHGKEKLDGITEKDLALLREKRWALYVARAAERYEAWWDSFPKAPLTERDMSEDTPRYTQFATARPSDLATFTREGYVLPPLDVLMVWHAHMLNPRAYLEDCMRHGLNQLWHQGMPWQLINAAIDSSFNYNVSAPRKEAWERATKRSWDCADGSFSKTLPPCPKCRTQVTVPWTTCGTTEKSPKAASSLIGEGYGDGDFKIRCRQCSSTLDRKYLEVAKFGADVKSLLAQGYPMPGTTLNNKTGMIRILPQTEQFDLLRSSFQRTFPNRLITQGLRTKLYDPPPSSMDDVRKIIEQALADNDMLKRVEGVNEKDKLKKYRLGQEARVHIRKMMARYWGNSSPFALELGGAVLRQGIFTEKMYKMDWLHSPAARETMTRLIKKYERFTNIMGKHPSQVAVPTLDVDLAWHTHQLSPSHYYQWMCSKTSKFIDHDDKIDENKLSTAFEWTSKTYQEMYGEVYSECTCWYCESVRTSHVSSIAVKLPIFKREKDKAPDNFYESGRAALCPPDNSAHISAHNSVRVTNNDSKRSMLQKRLQLRHQKRLEDNYEKARKRAKAKGRELPPRDDYYGYYWGAPYLLYGPYVYPAYYVCPIYYDSSTVAAGSGYYGACAAGTCGGTAAAGACGGASAGGCGGGCGGGGCGGVSCGSSGSACGGGGGGGGCGGGGGGGCGGGGGS